MEANRHQKDEIERYRAEASQGRAKLDKLRSKLSRVCTENLSLHCAVKTTEKFHDSLRSTAADRNLPVSEANGRLSEIQRRLDDQIAYEKEYDTLLKESTSCGNEWDTEFKASASEYARQ